MSLIRSGCHAAPLHESLPVAWRRLLRPARRLTAGMRAWWQDLRADMAALNAAAREARWHQDPRPLLDQHIKLRAARRPADQPVRGSVRVQTRLLQGEPEAGPAPIPSGPAGAVPVPPVTGTAPLAGWALAPVLYGERGEHPYPVREAGADTDWELLLAGLEPAGDGTEALS